jgi:predicted small metal-binding protein
VKGSLRCECGWAVTGDDVDELVEDARAHASRKHRMDVPAELLRRRARDAVRDGSPVSIAGAAGLVSEGGPTEQDHQGGI